MVIILRLRYITSEIAETAILNDAPSNDRDKLHTCNRRERTRDVDYLTRLQVSDESFDIRRE